MIPLKQVCGIDAEDVVALLAEGLSFGILPVLRDKMLQSTTGRQILKERPLVSSKTVSFEQLKTLPENTFGHSYVKFMEKHKISPDTRAPVETLFYSRSNL